MFGPHVAVKLDADFYCFRMDKRYLRALVLFYISFLSNFVCSKQGFNFTNTLQKLYTIMATVQWVIFKHHKKSDGTYNPKIQIIHKSLSAYIPSGG